jgi:citronellyl-CoA synthetase
VDGVDELDLDAFSAFVNENLPAYARPVFVRVQQEIGVTGTFKMVKGDLREQGYDLSKVSDPIYVMKPKEDRYQPLDKDFAATLAEGRGGY